MWDHKGERYGMALKKKREEIRQEKTDHDRNAIRHSCGIHQWQCKFSLPAAMVSSSPASLSRPIPMSVDQSKENSQVRHCQTDAQSK
jgi:hypothetical protein